MCDVLVAEEIDDSAIEWLEQKYSVHYDPDLWKNREDLRERLEGVRALIVRNQTQVNEEILPEGETLSVIGRAGVGYDNIDVSAASERGAVVCYTPGANAVSTAEHTFALVLALVRNIPQAHASTKEGGWERSRFVGSELYDKTLGVLGIGNVGMRVAHRAKAFGMEVLAHDKYISEHHPPVTETGATLVSLDELLKRGDVVCNHLPATDETRDLIDYSRLKKMKQTARIVNTARGQTIVEQDLIRALEEGVIAGAALDVREEEPPEVSELNNMENVILTPHIAAFTQEAQENVINVLVNDVDSVLSGREASSYLNFGTPRNI